MSKKSAKLIKNNFLKLLDKKNLEMAAHANFNNNSINENNNTKNHHS